MIKPRTEYKKEVRMYNYKIDSLQKTKQLLNAKYKNAKQYSIWQLLKYSVSQNTPQSISSEKFAKYFKYINNPEDSYFQADEDIVYFNDRFLNLEMQIMFDELNVSK